MSSQTLSEQDMGTTTVSVRVPRKVYEKLSEVAQNEQRSVSNLVNVIIAKHLYQE